LKIFSRLIRKAKNWAVAGAFGLDLGLGLAGMAAKGSVLTIDTTLVQDRLDDGRGLGSGTTGGLYNWAARRSNQRVENLFDWRGFQDFIAGLFRILHRLLPIF
jgi:hypothetical protein